jgi:hypothetical protein
MSQSARRNDPHIRLLGPIQPYWGSTKNVELIQKDGLNKPADQNTHVVKTQMKHTSDSILAIFRVHERGTNVYPLMVVIFVSQYLYLRTNKTTLQPHTFGLYLRIFATH